MQVVAEVLLRKGRQTFSELLRNINSATRSSRQLHLSSSNGGSKQSPTLTAGQLKQVRRQGLHCDSGCGGTAPAGGCTCQQRGCLPCKFQLSACSVCSLGAFALHFKAILIFTK